MIEFEASCSEEMNGATTELTMDAIDEQYG